MGIPVTINYKRLDYFTQMFAVRMNTRADLPVLEM